MLVNVADYGPDIADLNVSFTDELTNVLAAEGGYIPAPAFVSLTSALAAKPLGWCSMMTLAGSVNFFVGTGTKLYKLNSSTLAFDDVSKPATTYGAVDTAPWCIKAFGDYVIAVNQNDAPQVYQVGVDTAFRDLGGSPPRAGIVRIWDNFVALMQLTTNPARVQWSALNNCESWTPGTNSSDYQDFPDGGVVQGSTEATNPLIFLQKAVIKAQFVPGSAEIFTFQKIQNNRGAQSAYSIAHRGDVAFFADTGGFFQIGPDGSIAPIGFERVDRTVFKRLAQSSVSTIQGSVDPFYSRVYWAVDYDGNGIFEQLLVYDWQLSKWTTININHYGVFPMVTSGYTLEGLDSISASIEDLPYPLDSKAWQGGAPLLGAFDTSFKLGSFSGTSLEAVVTTPELGDTTGAVMRTSASMPIVNTGNLYVSVGVRMRRGDAIAWLPEVMPSRNTGLVKRNTRARYHRFKIRIPAGETWAQIKGIDVATTPAGIR